MTMEEKAVYLKLMGWIQVPMDDPLCLGFEPYAWRPEGKILYTSAFLDKNGSPSLLWTDEAYDIAINS